MKVAPHGEAQAALEGAKHTRADKDPVPMLVGVAQPPPCTVSLCRRAFAFQRGAYMRMAARRAFVPSAVGGYERQGERRNGGGGAEEREERR